MLPTKPPKKKVTALSGWGRYPRADQTLSRPEKAAQLVTAEESVLARGQGRSYGDAALNSGGELILTERLNRFLEFDSKRGVLKVEAGATLKEILDAMVPKGWFLPVTPGTKFSSVGGCVAADVHGKNHHRDGSFGQHVLSLDMVLADGSRYRCSPTEREDLFWATVGGMGLTGIIESVTFQMIPIETAYVKVRHRKAANLDVVFNVLEDDRFDDRYSVCWIDCLSRGKKMGRGIVMTGHHASKSEVPLMSHDPLRLKPRKVKTFKREWPRFALNPMSIRMFNAYYFWREGRKREFRCDYNEFFYPLDRINDWNKMYGKRGFVQYQFVVPMEGARECMRKVVGMFSRSRRASFLAVLKRMGPEDKGLLSFPREGYTLALDVPLSNDLLAFLERVDEVVLDHGGRVYLAKDSRLPADTFRKMYPKIEEFLRVKRAVDPDWKFRSDLAKRLEIGP
ncbi:MAG TPA: FAD-binding oxidoreductase [Fimbriimonadaceae bacterium]|nr:FAD-binding oxidoreductase [Fimbriimonadaceae bacterium]